MALRRGALRRHLDQQRGSADAPSPVNTANNHESGFVDCESPTTSSTHHAKRNRTETTKLHEVMTRIHETLQFVHTDEAGQICHHLLATPVDQLEAMHKHTHLLNDHVNTEILHKITACDFAVQEGVFRLASQVGTAS